MSTTAGAGRQGPVDELLTAVRSGRLARIPELLAALDPAQRRSGLAALKELRKELRQDWSREAAEARGRLLVAGAGCHAGPAGAAVWLAGSDFADRPWARNSVLHQAVEAQPVEWQVEVVTRLAARPARNQGWSMYPVMEAVVRRTGCEVPRGETFVRGWMDRVNDFGSGGARPTLAEKLRQDAFTPVLLPELLELADISWPLTFRHSPRPGDIWTEAIGELAAAGVVDRTELLDRCLARLLRGGKPGDQRAFLEVLRALDPTPAEYAARVRDLVALLDGQSVLAGHAQEVLAGLDEAGLIEPEVLPEASAVVLFRTEKKLVRAQLAWLDKAARRAPDRSGPVVLAAAEAFGHPDTALQERALNVVARHLKAAGEAVVAELRTAAEVLNPAHHRRAGDLLGAPVGGDEDGPDAGWNAFLPPAPEPRPLGAPIGSAVELAEELSALLASGEPAVADFERVLDGLVRLTHLDRKALAEAVEPVRRVHPWRGTNSGGDCMPREILYVVAAVAGETPPWKVWDYLGRKGRSVLRGAHTTVHGAVLAARLEEAAWQVDRARLPYLLATPTDATGAMDAAVLVERIAGYEAAGVTPGKADLSQALLRVDVRVEEAVLKAAEALTSPAGRWLAHWLRTGGLPGQPSERVLFAPGKGVRRTNAYGDRWWEDVERIAVAQPGIGAGPKGPGGERLTAEPLALLDGTEPSVARARKVYGWTWRPVAHWFAMLPWHREELAARWLDPFAEGADRDERGAARYLPLLAEAGGPAGLALHLALAYGLGARHAEDRTAAVDALLVLAARGDLDGALLGRELGALVACGTVMAGRLGAALTTAAETGARATVWSVLAAALPGLLGEADPSTRGLGDLIALATDCARRTGARGPVAEVTATAERGGSGRVVKEARALRDVLAG
ncbi:DUF6493 family protein [Kitasatospora sp. NPDC091257]|uniref:DUF7824 domain-containing protein n=1 Tax=Kitasatospora sp. NPDC091257 TaxID=3364084 RepID=UPI00382BE1C5